MAIRITDNVMNRPMSPGEGPRGLDASPERVLGNSIAPAQAVPQVNQAAGPYAGMSNPMAARTAEMEGQMWQQTAKVVEDTALRFEALKMADEDQRGTTASIKIRERERDLRKTLAGESAANNWSADEEQSQYSERLQKIRDEEFEAAGIQHPRLAKKYEQDWEVIKSNYALDYQTKAIQPRIVANAQKSVQSNLQSELKSVADEGTVESAQSAMTNIDKYLANPAVVAVLGPEEVQRQRNVALKAVVNTVLAKTQDRLLDIDRGPLLDMSGDAINDQVLVHDVRSQIDYVLDNLPMDADDREKLRLGLHRDLDQKAEAKRVDIRQEAAEKERATKESTRLLVGQADVQLGEAAAQDNLSRSKLESVISSLRKALPEDPESQLAVDQLRVRYLDNIHRAEKERARDVAARAAGNTPGADQGSTDKAFKQFVKTHLKGQSYEAALANPQTRDVVLATTSTWMKQNGVIKLPKEIDSAVSKMLMSHDKATFNQGYAVFQQLKQAHPELVGQLDDKALDIASRVADGQPFESARTAAIARASRTKEQIAAEKEIARVEVDKEKQKGALSNLSKTLGGSLTPQVWAAYQREVEDGVAMNLPVTAAMARAQSVIATRTGKSTLVEPNGKTTVMLDAPEKVFGTTAENIKEDIREKGKEYGLDKNSKFTLHPTGRMDAAGRPLYAIALHKEDKSIEFMTSPSGTRVLYSYDARTAPATKRALAEKAHRETIDVYNDMLNQASRDNSLKFGTKGFYDRSKNVPYAERGMTEAEVKKIPGFNAKLWEIAKKQVIRE